MAKKSKGSRLDGYDKASNPTKRPRGPDANYDFSRQVQPEAPLGHGSYANMPEKPMIKAFPYEANYRDGVVNGFTANLDMLTDIDENEC